MMILISYEGSADAQAFSCRTVSSNGDLIPS